MADLVLVDASVWIDSLGEPGSAVSAGVRDLEWPRTTGLIVQEVLQGVRSTSVLARVGSLLARVPALSATRETHTRAAALHRTLRSRGITAGTIDVLLAQLAVDNGARLWTLDEDFTAIAKHSKLRLYKPLA